jgi:signal transduction histidine kinase
MITIKIFKAVSSIIFISCIFFSTFLTALPIDQVNGFPGEKVDSLKKVIAAAKEDSLKVKAMLILAEELVQKGLYTQAIQDASLIRKLSRKIAFQNGEGLSWMISGLCLMRSTHYDSALYHFSKAQLIFSTHGSRTEEARCYLYIGQACDYLAQYKNALTYYRLAIEKCQGVNDKTILAKIYNSIGVTYMNMGNKEVALENYLHSAKTIATEGATRSYAAILNNIGVIYEELGQYEEALTYFALFTETSQKLGEKYLIAIGLLNKGEIFKLLGKYAQSVYFLTGAVKIQRETGDNRGLSLSYNNLGDIFFKTKVYTLAEKNYQKSYYLAGLIKNNDLAIKPMLGITQLYIHTGRFKEAKISIKKILNLVDHSGSRAIHEHIYLVQSKLDSAQGHFREAYLWHKKYTYLKDSLLNYRNSKQIIQMRELYENEKKDKEILRLNEAHTLDKVNQDNNKKLFLITCFFSGLIICGLTFWLFMKARHSATIKKEKNKVAQANKDLEALIEKIEEQKQILALKNENLEELHREKDGLIGVVAHDLRSPINRVKGLTTLLPLIGGLNADQIKLADTIKKVCDDGCNLIRDLLDINQYEFSEQTTLAELELNNFFDELLGHYDNLLNQKNLTLSFKKNIIKETFVTTDASYLTRIMDNLITNAIKFSPPHRAIHLTLETENDSIFKIILKDEGPGFHNEDIPHLFKKFKKLSARPTAGESSTGLGLSIVKTLVNKLNGEIAIENAPGKGATFILSMPLVPSRQPELA